MKDYKIMEDGSIYIVDLSNISKIRFVSKANSFIKFIKFIKSRGK